MSPNSFNSYNQNPNNSQDDGNTDESIERLNALAGFNQDEPAENTLTINFDDSEEDELLVPPGELDNEAPVSRMSFMPPSLNKVAVGVAVLLIIMGVGWYSLGNSQENEEITADEREQIEAEKDSLSNNNSDILSENGEELGKLKAELALKDQEKELEKINQQVKSSSQKQKTSTPPLKQPTPKTTQAAPPPRKVQTPPPPSPPPPPNVSVQRVPRPTPTPPPPPNPTVTSANTRDKPTVDPSTAWLTASKVGSFGGKDTIENKVSTTPPPIVDGPYEPIDSGTDDPGAWGLVNQPTYLQSFPQPYSQPYSPSPQTRYQSSYQQANYQQPMQQVPGTDNSLPVPDPMLEAPVLNGVKRDVAVIPPNTRIQGVLREAISWDSPRLVEQAPVLIQLSQGITDEEGKQIIPPGAEVTAMVQQARPSGLVLLTVTSIDFPTEFGYRSIAIPPFAISIKQVSGMPLMAQKIQQEGQQPGVDTGGLVLDVLGATLPVLNGGSSGNPYRDMYQINQIQQLYGKYRQQQPQDFSATARATIWHLQQDTEVELIIRQPIRIFQEF